MVKEKLVKRITEYLSLGGLFNPEMMLPETVRDLLIDCRTFLQTEQPLQQAGCYERAAADTLKLSNLGLERVLSRERFTHTYLARS
jgi:hypothetical protein